MSPSGYTDPIDARTKVGDAQATGRVGVLTLDRPDQAAPRYDKGAEAVRTALEMADLFSNLRAAAAR